MTWKQSITGAVLDLKDLSPLDVRSKDISHVLGMMVRFGGHTRRWYSVGEHCVLLAEYFLKQGEVDLAREALIHDAHEYILGDMAAPFKPLLGIYRAYETACERVVRRACDVPLDLSPRVKEADTRILMDEREQCLGKPTKPWANEEEPLGITIRGWTPWEARRQYDLMAQKLDIRVNGSYWEAWT